MNSMELERLLNVGIALSANADSDNLMREIVDVAMDMTDCDAGTLYILEDNQLVFHIMVTLSLGIDQGGHGEKISLPPVALNPNNVCAWSALNKQLINIEDVYTDSRFDFSGPRRYDSMTGYRTQSMLVIPMLDDTGAAIGVLQLLNAKIPNGTTVAFPKDCEQVIQSLASQAAIRLTNLNYSREITKLLESMVQVLSTAIDARSPYNANHTRNMAKYGQRFLGWLRENHEELSLTMEEEKEFLMAVWLHDIGKLVTPLEVMDKPSRLAGKEQVIKQRLERIEMLAELRMLRGELSREAFEEIKKQTADAFETITKVNNAGFLQDELMAKVQDLVEKTYVERSGETVSWLTPEEVEALSVRKGTLTAKERNIMEEHVVMTEKLLQQMHFSKSYGHVIQWAASHHEYLNGTGYPRKYQAEELPFPVRLLTILDIFDALTAKDRPYKKSMPETKALEILRSMVKDGQLDGEIVDLFAESTAWEDRGEQK